MFEVVANPFVLFWSKACAHQLILMGWCLIHRNLSIESSFLVNLLFDPKRVWYLICWCSICLSSLSLIFRLNVFPCKLFSSKDLWNFRWTYGVCPMAEQAKTLLRHCYMCTKECVRRKTEMYLLGDEFGQKLILAMEDIFQLVVYATIVNAK